MSRTKHPVYKSIASILIIFAIVLVIVVFSTSKRSNAEVSIFYPESCLGGWTDTEHAQGKPDIDAVVSGYSQFGIENSAHINSDTLSEIYCGGFKGTIPENATPQKFLLKLSWAFKFPGEPEEIEIISTTTTTAATTTASTSTLELVATTTSTSTSTSTSTPVTTTAEGTSTPDIETSTTTDTTTESATTTPTEDKATSTPITEPAAASSTGEVSVLDIFTNIAYASDVLETDIATSTVDDATTSATTTATSTSTTTPVAIDDVPEQDLFEVLYTFDGKTWKSLGMINAYNWQDANFVISSPSLISWADISKVQISVKSLSSVDVHPTVYLDGMSLEVLYSSSIIDPLEKKDQDLTGRRLHFENMVSEGHASSTVSVDTSSKEKIIVNGKKSTSFRIYNVDDKSFDLSIGVGDDAVEFPAYLFSPGHYVLVDTSAEDACFSLSYAECKAKSYEGAVSFYVTDLDLIQ